MWLTKSLGRRLLVSLYCIDVVLSMLNVYLLSLVFLVGSHTIDNYCFSSIPFDLVNLLCDSVVDHNSRLTLCRLVWE
ncbi:hypothetical protein BJ875DRAFT_465860 [Amylocarpus encephaloides]|uniref:Uncharacterized protein n=1 Tax=Amylocarpus encephaloides TaxID=45428 RepID=A0A9P7YGH0_9HELO|nr:hypothetical protein BJ875DRAFT_465860 [Amylocarpus encephaloides]